MAKAFDILPPTIKKLTQPLPPAKKNKGVRNSVIAILASACLLAVVFWFFSKQSSSPQPEQKNQSTSQSNFELFNQEGYSSLEGSQNQPKIKILNGSGNDASLIKVESLLQKASYKVVAKDKSQNTYDQTIIYYSSKNKDLAQKVADSLKTDFQAKLQEQDITGENYNILIIIGTK